MLSRPFRSPLLKRPASDENNENPPIKEAKVEPTGLVFKKPGISVLPRKPLLEVGNAAPTLGVVGTEGYYSVLWRNVTKKKHKTWEGDALLYVSNEGFAELHNGETTRSMGNAKCHEPLLPGSSLFIAGKDVEIEQILSKAQYLARRRVSAAIDENFDDPVKTTTNAGKEAATPNFKPQAPASTGSQQKVKHSAKIALTTVKITTARQESLDTSHPKTATRTLQVETTSPPQCLPPPSDALVMKRPLDAKVDVVVDPILSKKLREHQREGVKFLYECVMGLREFNGQGAILADEMGLGKTLQTIALLWTLLKQSPYGHGSTVIKKALIVCPATLINNWRKEIRKWLGLDRIGVLVADAKTRVSHFTHGKSYSVMIISYERLRTIQAELAKGQGVDIIVADEAHRLKTAKNKSLQAINSLPTEKKIFLTGTPVQNDLSEFYMMVDSVNQGILGSKKAFTRELEIPIARGRQPAASAEDVEQGEECSRELVRLTSPFILRRTVDVLAKYLPMKTEHVLLCKPTQAQAALYRYILGSPAFCAATLGNSECSLQLITLLKKVCNSPALLKGKVDVDGTPETSPSNAALLASIPPHLLRNNAGSTKLRMLDGLLHTLRTTTDEKVVLVSNYTSTLDLLGRLLTSVGHPFSRIDGSTPSNKRQEIIDDFNRSPAESCFAFLLSAKAGGLGINLIGASRLVLFDVDWNPATDLQAMARIHRDGQKRACFIYRFVMAGGIEEKIFQRQIVKLGLASNVMDQKEESSSFTKEDLKDLFRLDEGVSCQTHDLIGCRCEGCGTETPEPDEDGEAEKDLPTLADIVKTGIVDAEKQGTTTKAATRLARDALMNYTHIDTSDFGSSGSNDKEALIKDDILLNTLKDEGNSISFVFSRVQL
ncbi:MAG: hypothetical protein L6R36_001802 [Xanthoria steineri]|nr:MAG: hypothetical protein L6R36_001802 [Xanthoria steineri]